MQNIVQVAGIIDSEEAKLCFENGADWIGFPLRLPSGKACRLCQYSRLP